MKNLIALFLFSIICTGPFSQVLFQSDLSSWTDGVPDGWGGPQTYLDPGYVAEIEGWGEYGTSEAGLVNAPSDPRRFTTQEMSVSELTTYEIKLWVRSMSSGAMLRTGYYNTTGDTWYYNEYLDIHLLFDGDYGMISQTVTMPEGCTDAEFVISFLSTSDPIGIELDSAAIVVSETSEIEEAAKHNELLFYPNPANNMVTFNVNSTAQIAIYTMTGIVAYKANGNIKEIDVSEFETGVYQVVITDNAQTATRRLIVN